MARRNKAEASCPASTLSPRASRLVEEEGLDVAEVRVRDRHGRGRCADRLAARPVAVELHRDSLSPMFRGLQPGPK